MENDLISRSAVLEILSNEFDMAAEERADADNEKDRAFNAGEINCARRSTRKVKELPAVDAAPVVRCKDCMWWNLAGCSINIVDDSDKPGPGDFCSFGERKDAEEG